MRKLLVASAALIATLGIALPLATPASAATHIVRVVHGKHHVKKVVVIRHDHRFHHHH